MGDLLPQCEPPSFATEPPMPPLPPPWEAQVQALQDHGLHAQDLLLRDQVRGLEAGGAPPEVLAAAITRLFHPERGWPRCSCCIDTLEDVLQGEEHNHARSSWVISTLVDPVPVLAVLGHTPLGVLAHRVAHQRAPGHWLDGEIRRFLDQEVVQAVTAEGLSFRATVADLDLRWAHQGVNGHLEILDPVGGLHLPPYIRCQGWFVLRGGHGLTRLPATRVMGDGSTAVVEACPDIEDLELPRAAYVKIVGCAGLRTIRGTAPLGDLEVVGCPVLEEIKLKFAKEIFSPPGITLRDCPSLGRLSSTSRVRRVIGNLTVTGCPALHLPLRALVVTGRVDVEGGPGPRDYPG
jgi:hypothetical protein